MVRIRIPATSANLGAGFDCLGLAVTMYNYVNIDEYEGISITSLDGIDTPKDEQNLIFKTAKTLYDRCGRRFPGLRIEEESNIPMARGLGSSSACIIAALVGANELLGRPFSREELLDMAAMEEGHPDNVAPALLGGLVTAALQDGKVWSVRQPLRDDLRFVAVVPDFELKTAEARAALPQEIPHKDGVFNLSRAALMSASLTSGEYGNLKTACDDRLHQPYRLGLIRCGRQMLDACGEQGAYGAYLSGAGPTLMALVSRENSGFAEGIRIRLEELGLTNWRVHVLSGDNTGAQIVEQKA